MERIAEPLRRMGADVETTEGRAPFVVRGAPLHGIEYELPVASAQVKSAVLLAGMSADGADHRGRARADARPHRADAGGCGRRASAARLRP